MKMKKFFIVFLLSIFTFGRFPKAAITSLNITRKQGIYDLTEFQGYYDNIKLLTPNNPMTFILIDSNGKMKYYANLNSGSLQIKLGPLEKGDIAIIVGTGEVIATHTKS